MQTDFLFQVRRILSFIVSQLISLQCILPWEQNKVNSLDFQVRRVLFVYYVNVLVENYWAQEPNQRKFFISFARSNGFDLLVPENWYSIGNDQVVSFRVSLSIRIVKRAHILQGGYAVLEYYGGSVPKSLLHLFPNIGLDINRFSNKPSMPSFMKKTV